MTLGVVVLDVVDPTRGALVGMTPDLRRAYERVRALLAAAARDEARSRYEVGTIVSDIKVRRDKYGTRAVEQLARAVGTNVHTLYRCASVVECWSLENFECLQTRVNRFGQPLSWSHLVVLSGVGSERRRAQLIERALCESLSVRDLTILIEGNVPCSESAPAQRALHRIVRMTERFSETAIEMHDDLLEELDRTGTEGGTSALIDRAIAVQEELRTVLERQLERLRSERTRLSRGSSQRTLPPSRSVVV